MQRDFGAAKTTFSRVSKMLPGNSEVRGALGRVTRREGYWDQSIAYYDQALILDPRNVELLFNAAATYAELRQFPAALKLYDRVLDITPNEPEALADKAGIYQAQGNLPQAADLLREVNAQSSSDLAFGTKLTQLRLERSYGDAVQFLQARLAQFHYTSEDDQGRAQTALAHAQRFAGDTAGAQVSAEQARNTLEQLKDQSNDDLLLALHAEDLSRAYAVMGKKDPALKEAERAIMLVPRAKDAVDGPGAEENLALIQTIFGENSRAISTLSQLLETPYSSSLYAATPITPALLRLDPLWDPLRPDPAFQKLCEEKQP